MNSENRQNCIDTIDKIKEKIPALKKMNDKKATESEIVLPILQSLGWDILDQDQVIRDYQVNLDKPKTIDYALISESNPVVYVNIKPVSVYPTFKHETELIQLCYASKIDLSLLTNGQYWHICYCNRKYSEPKVSFDLLKLGSFELCECFNETLGREAVISGTTAGAIQIERSFDCFCDIFSYLLVEDPELSQRVRLEIQKQYDLKLSEKMVNGFLAEVEGEFHFSFQEDSTYEE